MAVAMDCSARATRNMRTMVASESKSRLTWTVQVASIISRPNPPLLGMCFFMMA